MNRTNWLLETRNTRFEEADAGWQSKRLTQEEAGGKVEKINLTEFGRALRQLGIEMIAAYFSGSSRSLGTGLRHPPGTVACQKLQLAGISDRIAAHCYLREVYRPAFNQEFTRPARETGFSFVPFLGGNLDDTLCVRFSVATSDKSFATKPDKSILLLTVFFYLFGGGSSYP